MSVFEESKYHAKHAGDSSSPEIFFFRIMYQKAKQQEIEKKKKKRKDNSKRWSGEYDGEKIKTELELRQRCRKKSWQL